MVYQLPSNHFLGTQTSIYQPEILSRKLGMKTAGDEFHPDDAEVLHAQRHRRLGEPGERLLDESLAGDWPWGPLNEGELNFSLINW